MHLKRLKIISNIQKLSMFHRRGTILRENKIQRSRTSTTFLFFFYVRTFHFAQFIVHTNKYKQMLCICL